MVLTMGTLTVRISVERQPYGAVQLPEHDPERFYRAAKEQAYHILWGTYPANHSRPENRNGL